MLTKKQKNVLDFIKSYIEKQGYAPSLGEIQKNFKLASVSTAHFYVKKLEESGYLEKKSNQPRAIEINPSNLVLSPIQRGIGYDSISLPILGSANCGPANIIAEENIDGFLKISSRLIKRKDGLFVLRASGNSLNKADIDGNNIEDGDFVIIDSLYKNPKNGDYVLSVIDGMANLKKYTIDKLNNQIMLISESTDNFKPIFISPSDDFAINGKIIGIVKK